jgi:hypothetical protein
LLKGVQRLNIANEIIETVEKKTVENNNSYLLELKKMQDKEAKI